MLNELMLVVGRTGAGKSTIAKKIADMFDRPIVKSYTTRPMREGETEETADHIFIDAKDIDLYKDDFAAYTKIGDYEYFITWSLLEDYASKGAIYIIDPIGVWDLQKSMKEADKEINLRTLYVKADKDKRMSRLKSRGDDEDTIQKRLEAEEEQFNKYEERIDEGLEKVLIINNSVDNNESAKERTNGVRVLGATLLSIEEAERFLSKKDREYSRWWWLRSPGDRLCYAAYVDCDGFISYYGHNTNIDRAYVRPALNIDLGSSNLKVGDTFYFGGKKFEIIADDLAFCLSDIGTSLFKRSDSFLEGNDYELSDVKKIVDQWFEEAKKLENVNPMRIKVNPMRIKIKSATLLSDEEAKTLLTEKERRYEKENWWLRSPGDDCFVAYVYTFGRVDCVGDFAWLCNFCVRPVLEIDIESSVFMIGDTFRFGGKNFRIISDKLAFCLDDIGTSLFRRDDRTLDDNDYELSDVKKIVDQWFEEAKKMEESYEHRN